MTAFRKHLTPSEAAKRLGVSIKALRLYEQHGLLSPSRSTAGWRVYSPGDLTRAAEIAAFRALGFSLAQISRVLDSDPQTLAEALALQEASLESEEHKLAGRLTEVRRLRTQLAGGRSPGARDLLGPLSADGELAAAFDLPWPWGGERFELRELKPLTYIVGPLGSGKTRFAKRLAETLSGATFLGLERLDETGAKLRTRIAAEPALAARVDKALAWLLENGASPTDALLALVAALESQGPAAQVVDMIEEGLDQATQRAMIALLRRRASRARPMLIMTRSNAILDLDAVGSDEAILLCPANHGPPCLVPARRGAPGYEAVATCLASPEVRARTQGVIAYRPRVA